MDYKTFGEKRIKVFCFILFCFSQPFEIFCLTTSHAAFFQEERPLNQLFFLTESSRINHVNNTQAITVYSERSNQVSLAKSELLLVLETLTGWCSEFKALKLFDLILNIKPSTIVEIGVWGGRSFIPMAFALKEIGCGKIYGIDPWSAQVSIQGMDPTNKKWWSSVEHEPIRLELVQKIEALRLEKHISLVHSSSAHAPLIEKIDLLHIDGSPIESAVLFDVIKWSPSVQKGGLIILSDSTSSNKEKAVQWLDAHYNRIADFHEDSDWSIWIVP